LKNVKTVKTKVKKKKMLDRAQLEGIDLKDLMKLLKKMIEESRDAILAKDLKSFELLSQTELIKDVILERMKTE
jgi:hypothetical protein